MALASLVLFQLPSTPKELSGCYLNIAVGSVTIKFGVVFHSTHKTNVEEGVGQGKELEII